jgi:hypothetical protein
MSDDQRPELQLAEPLKGEIRAQPHSADSISALLALKALAEVVTPEVLSAISHALFGGSSRTSGILDLWGKISDKTKSQQYRDAQIYEVAEAKFKERIEHEEKILIDPQDLQKTNEYLSQEITQVVEDAAKTDDQKLMNEAVTFYVSSMRRLYLLGLNGFEDKRDLPIIGSRLGALRIKVMWANAHRSARNIMHKQEVENEQKEREEQHKQEMQVQREVFLWLLFYLIIIGLIILLSGSALTSTTIVPLLGIPASIILWSAIGSMTNLLYKFYKQDSPRNTQQELRWVYARPLVGIVMGMVLYLTITSGLMVLGAVTPKSGNIELRTELLCLFAFMGGFSDKIFEGVIEKIGLISMPEKEAKEDYEKLLEIAKASGLQKVGSTNAPAKNVEPPVPQPVTQKLATPPKNSKPGRNSAGKS